MGRGGSSRFSLRVNASLNLRSRFNNVVICRLMRGVIGYLRG